MTSDPGAHFLANSIERFRKIRALGDRALERVDDERLWNFRLDPESNTLATLVRHVAGNLRSRWSDFLTTDGEKPDRDRDSEFEDGAGREELLSRWNEGWELLFRALEPLTASDLMRQVTIRGEEHTVIEAIQRQLEHYAYHVGQIVFLAKHLKAGSWESLSVPRGKSAGYWPGPRQKTP